MVKQFEGTVPARRETTVTMGNGRSDDEKTTVLEEQRANPLLAEGMATVAPPSSEISHGDSNLRSRLLGLTPRNSSARILSREEKAEVVSIGKAWSAINRDLLNSLDVGTVVAVHVLEGTYVTASTRLVAMDLFQARFGTGAIAWIHEVGVPISIGSGLSTLSSGA